jgi:hypothetical protein
MGHGDELVMKEVAGEVSLIFLPIVFHLGRHVRVYSRALHGTVLRFYTVLLQLLFRWLAVFGWSDGLVLADGDPILYVELSLLQTR